MSDSEDLYGAWVVLYELQPKNTGRKGVITVFVV